MDLTVQFEQTGKSERERKRQELKQLQVLLSQLELDLLNLRTELRAFELRYLQLVGRFIAELDEVEAQISELLFELFPKDPAYEEKAQDSRARADQSAQEAHYANEQPKEKTRFQAPDDLKSLYRNVAKKVHPDFAINEEDRLRRSELMKQANEAYEQKDYEKLKEILFDAELAEEQPESSDRERAEIERLDQYIARVKSRIASIQTEMEAMLGSELYQLMLRVMEADQAGRDLLAEIVNNLKEQIKNRKARLQELVRAYERKSAT